MATIIELQQKMIDESTNIQNKHKYSDKNKYADGNITLALTNALLSYNTPEFFNNPNFYKEIASAATSITNPETFPDVSNPLVHNITLIPGMAGLIARSIPNALAPIHPLLGATTYSAKFVRGEDRILSLFLGAPYIRPTLSPPFYKKIEGTYNISNPPTYSDVVVPTTVQQYRDSSNVNLYSENNKRYDGSIARGYSEVAKDSNDKINYSQLFGGANKSIQKPLVRSIELSSDDQKASRFFAAKSSRTTSLEKNVTSSNLRGVINFDTTNGGNLFSNVVEMNNIYFPFAIVDMRTKFGVVLRPYSESDVVKENFQISVDEDNYIGRIGSIYRYKNTNRKITFNFILVAESEDDLQYMNGKLNFLKNMLYPTYRDFSYDISNTTININVMNASPIIEVRFGNYIYNPTSVGVVQGVMGIITSFDADPYRFNWEITTNKQIPQGFKISMEVSVINQNNPGLRINSDNSFEYTKFVDIG